MKTGTVRNISIVLGVASMLLVACREDVASTADGDEVPPLVTATVDTPKAPPAPEPVEQKIDPATLNLSPGVAEVVKLTQSGIDESVILAFVQNSTNEFNPSSDELVYLNDTGISSKVMSAMLDRGRKLRDQQNRIAAISNAPPIKVVVENAPPAAPEPAPAPPVVATPAPGTTITTTPPTTVVVLPPDAPQEVVYFYEPLSPYGSWINLPGHGWCWQPTVAAGSHSWRPYADRGRWVYSDSGWYWQSDYSWGWAAFHYGRWLDHSRHGWVWVPDTTWAGAWVAWRSSDTMCGWAPLPPSARYDYGRGLHYYDMTAGVNCDFGLNASHFTFISKFRFLDRNPNHYFIPHTQAQTVYNTTIINNNYTVDSHRNVNNGGLSARQLAEMTRTEVRQVSVRPTDNPTVTKPDRMTRDGSDYVIYRPRLEKAPVASAKPAPAAKDTTVGTFTDKNVQRIALITPESSKPATTVPGYNPQVPHWLQPDVKTPPLWPGNSTDTSSTQPKVKADTERTSTPERQFGKAPSRRGTGGIIGGQANSLKPLSPPQPITSTAQPLSPPWPVTSTPQPLTPPQPITSTPQPLSPPWPVTSTPQPLTPPQPITSVPQPMTPPQPVRTIVSFPTSPQASVHYYDQTAARPARSTANPPNATAPATPASRPNPIPQTTASYNPATTQPTRPAPTQPSYTAPSAPVTRPAPSAPAPSYSQPSRPAPVAPPARVESAPPPSAPRPQAAPSPASSNNDNRKNSEGRRQ